MANQRTVAGITIKRGALVLATERSQITKRASSQPWVGQGDRTKQHHETGLDAKLYDRREMAKRLRNLPPVRIASGKYAGELRVFGFAYRQALTGERETKSLRGKYRASWRRCPDSFQNRQYYASRRARRAAAQLAHEIYKDAHERKSLVYWVS